MPEDGLHTVPVRLDWMGRPGGGESRTGGGRKMKNHVCRFDQRIEYRLVSNRADGNAETWPAHQWRDILHTSRRKIIQHCHAMTGTKQSLRQMRPDESGATRYERPHSRFFSTDSSGLVRFIFISAIGDRWSARGR